MVPNMQFFAKTLAHYNVIGRMDLQIIVLGVWLNLLNKCCVHMFNKKSYANSVFD